MPYSSHLLLPPYLPSLPLFSSHASASLQTRPPTSILTITASAVTPPLISTATIASPSREPISEFPSPSSYSWIEELRSQARYCHFDQAILTYLKMIRAGIPPNNFALPVVLKAVAGIQDLDLGKQIHTQVVKFGYASSSVIVANSLVNLYGKCENIEGAFKVFERITERDRVSWNSMIAALCRFEEWELALSAFRLMLLENLEPSSFTLVSVALACSNLDKPDGLRLGKQVHAYTLRKGDWRTFTNNALMAMYAKLVRVDDSRALFELFDDKNMVSWNTIISSFSQNNQFMEALLYLRLMLLNGVKPDGVTLASVLPACSHLKMLNIGKELHSYAMKNIDLNENYFVGSALVDMYCNCKHVEKGRSVFDGILKRTVAVWNAMIAGYAQNECDEEALNLFSEMTLSNFFPTATTLSSILLACVRCEVFLDKEGIHGYVLKLALDKDIYVQNTLMDMYVRMGKIEIAKNIFNIMQVRNLVSWNTLITGYVVCGCYEDALNLLHDIQIGEEKCNTIAEYEDDERIPIKPNSVTLVTVLPGCAFLAALDKGKEIHAYAFRQMLVTDVVVGSALVDMYAKCGCLNLSRRVFDQMPMRNVITWNVLIMAYGMHGKGEEALELFKRMGAERARNGEVKPNEVTYTAIFVACSHSKMVDEGLNLFHQMKNDHGIEPTSDHYACVVDLLARSGQVEEAYRMINKMPPDLDKVDVWSTLLGSCQIHQALEIGEIAAKNLFMLEPDVASHYVLLSNIYSSAGLWDKAMDVWRKMKEKGVRKEPGCSWIEFGDEVHKFLAGDASHPQSRQLHEYLEILSHRMRREGFVPDTSCVLHNVDDEEKITLLCGHSEKLAIAFGILNTPPGTTVRVAKNLRVCNDCHTASKYISKIVDREIMLRDVRRFHHFKNGTCSCGDYW